MCVDSDLTRSASAGSSPSCSRRDRTAAGKDKNTTECGPSRICDIQHCNLTLNTLQQVLYKYLNHWDHDKFLGYFPYASVKNLTLNTESQFVCQLFNANGFNWIASPVHFEFDTWLLNQLAAFFNLKGFFTTIITPKNDKTPSNNPVERSTTYSDMRLLSRNGGIFTNGASEALFISLFTVKHFFNRLWIRSATENNNNNNTPRKCLIVYASTLAHCSIEKNCHVLNLKLKKISTIRGGIAENLLINEIRQDLNSQDCQPAIVYLSVGTTLIASDDCVYLLARRIKKLCPTVFIHVDAAYGGNFFCLEPIVYGSTGHFRRRENFGEMSTSVYINYKFVDFLNISLNKGPLGVSSPASCFWFKHRNFIVDAFFAPRNVNYLKNTNFLNSNNNTNNNVYAAEQPHFDYKNYGLRLSHEHVGLKIWHVLAKTSREEIFLRINHHLRMATYFKHMLIEKFKQHKNEVFCLNFLKIYYGVVCLNIVSKTAGCVTRQVFDFLVAECGFFCLCIDYTDVVYLRFCFKYEYNTFLLQSLTDKICEWCIMFNHGRRNKKTKQNLPPLILQSNRPSATTNANNSDLPPMPLINNCVYY